MNKPEDVRVGANEVLSESEKEQKLYNYWKWKTLLGFCVLYLFTYTGRLNMGIALPLLKTEFCWNNAQCGLVSSLIFWTYGFSHIVWGRLSDSLGARIFIGTGAIVSTILNWVVSFATSFWGIAIPWALNGLAQGMLFSPGTQMVSQWWHKKERGFAVSFIIFSSGWATVVVWFLASYIVAPIWGWRGVFQYPVLLMGFFGILSFFLIRNKPSDVGLKDYVEEDMEAAKKEESESTHGLKPFINCLKDWRLDVAFLAMGLANFNRYAFLTWIPLYYVETAGYNIAKAGMASIMLPVGMACGPLLAGWISDKFFKSNRYQIIAFYCLVASLVAIMIGFTDSKNLVLGSIFLFMAGFFVYGAHGPIWALCTDLAGRKKAGTAVGLMDFISYLFAGLSAAALGAMLHFTNGNWFLAFMIVAGISFTAMVLVMVTKR
ncbi:MAG: MFS transporter [Syntrophales bacterium]|nr:MFS transporter [Syntrophales bacterium]